MRMRFKPYARPELLQSSFFVETPTELIGKWHDEFDNSTAPIWLELGCGKGGYASQLAARHQDINLVAVDITDKVLILAKRNVEKVFMEQNLPSYNVRVTAFDIERIDTVFSKSDGVQRIYINFCNPWDRKSNQTKHRLTHTRQLLKYKELLADNGEIWFKCDHNQLFADSLEYFKEAGMEITWITYDLHENEPEWNIRTEHEEMFTQQGIPTKALIAKKL